MQAKQQIIDEIQKMKKEQNAVILAHVYQDPDIQDIADHIGDSLALSKKAIDIDASTIVFCGVKFMAETAHILNPAKKVLLPHLHAGCDLADMATIQQLKKQKEQHPNAAVVCYINSSAEIKAESDICCTSANAIKVVESINQEEVLFLPDKNLGSYVEEKTNKKIIPWNGYCYVHEDIQPKTIQSLKQKHPTAEVIVHPECNKTIRNLADCIGGTAKMATYVKQSHCKEFIVGTEDNFIHHLKKQNPAKIFHSVHTKCKSMRKISLADVKQALEQKKHMITLEEPIRLKALKTLENMMNIS